MGERAAEINTDCLIKFQTEEGIKGGDINEDEGEKGGESIGGD